MKKLIKSFFKVFGYAISPASKHFQFADPIVDQKNLFRNQKNMVIFDVGAHSGQTCLLYNHFFEDSMIYCFEPFPDSFELLKTNTHKFSNMKVFNYALGNNVGWVDLYVNESSYTNSLLPAHIQGSKTWGENLLGSDKTIQVNMLTIDEFVQKNEINQIDILKIDTQGTEYNVIEGAVKSIAREMINLVYLEILTLPTYQDQKYYDEVLYFLRKNNFHLYNLYNFSNTNLGELRQLDAIFLSNKFYNQLHNQS